MLFRSPGCRVATTEIYTVSDTLSLHDALPIAGCSVLRFDDQGLVVESRDYWHMEPGRREPHDTWGK